MELDMDPHRIAENATNSHSTTSQDPSPSLPTPSPPAAPYAVVASPNGAVTGRRHRSAAWDHFVRQDDYETSKKVACMHCKKLFIASGGSTSTMLQHLHNGHPHVLAGSANK